MNKNKLFSIITIICFCSVVLIPIGLVLMFFFCDWKKKIKYILLPVFILLYGGIIFLVLNIEPSNNKNGISIPGVTTQGSTVFESHNRSLKKQKGEILEGDDFSYKNGDSLEDEESVQVPVKVNNKKGNKPGRGFFYFLFILFMLFLIIRQNLKSKKNTGFENPYVDTKQYKFPLTAESKIPTIHFLKIPRKEGEKFLFATPGKYNTFEGDLLISNMRFAFIGNDSSDNLEFDINELDTAVSVSSTCFMLSRGEKKFHFFIDESQMKFVLNVLRFAARSL